LNPPHNGEGSAPAESFGFWVISSDPRVAESVGRAVEGTGTPIRALTTLPDPPEADPPFPPGWLLADLGSRSVDPSALETFKHANPDCQLFLVPGDPRAPVPTELARLGVRHWFLRPLDTGELRRVFRAALRSRRAEQVRVRSRSREFPGFDDLIGGAPSFREACDLARRAAASPSTVILIEGETGTGKGAFARAIHREGPRVACPFVEVNCASLPGQLLESELFGHEKGAFTHAQAAKPGLLELADSGTFFLDEVAETEPQVQAKILKFLDSGHYRRVGGLEEREVDVRVIAATQKDLEEEARAGRFRLDLYHRLHVIRIRIPPLRERPGDIRLLLGHYLDQFARRQGKPEMRWSPAALALLERQTWPGNVREIVNLCERAVLLGAGGGEILPEQIPESIAADRVVRARREGDAVRLEVPDGVTFEEIERAAIVNALQKARGNVSAAAASLAMGRGQFRYRMEKLGLIPPDPGDAARTRRKRATRNRGASRREIGSGPGAEESVG
jgi:DNA-binding NtrC family response regulator